MKSFLLKCLVTPTMVSAERFRESSSAGSQRYRITTDAVTCPGVSNAQGKATLVKISRFLHVKAQW